MTGLRYNNDKLPYHLLPDIAIEEVVRVLQAGAEKYSPRNWEKGLEWNSQCASSLQRHLARWKMGEDYDEESGLLHTAHIATNALFMLYFQLEKKGTDDRTYHSSDDAEVMTCECPLLHILLEDNQDEEVYDTTSNSTYYLHS